MLPNRWFLEEIMPTNSVASFMDGLTNFQFAKVPSDLDTDSLTVIANEQSGDNVFYGAEGKRNAVIRFLSLVIKKKVLQLCIYSVRRTLNG